MGTASIHEGVRRIFEFAGSDGGEGTDTGGSVFGTLPGRLPKDLRLAVISRVEAANAWLKAHYIAERNAASAITRYGRRPSTRSVFFPLLV
jgi:hypothetical protein